MYLYSNKRGFDHRSMTGRRRCRGLEPVTSGSNLPSFSSENQNMRTNNQTPSKNIREKLTNEWYSVGYVGKESYQSKKGYKTLGRGVNFREHIFVINMMMVIETTKG